MLGSRRGRLCRGGGGDESQSAGEEEGKELCRGGGGDEGQ